jgi:hypothetical protein
MRANTEKLVSGRILSALPTPFLTCRDIFRTCMRPDSLAELV